MKKNKIFTNEKIKSIITFLAIFLLTIMVLYFSLKDNFKMIIDQILSINIFWFLGSLLLMISYWLLRSMVVYIFAKKFKKDYQFKQSVNLTLTTQFFHAVTPFATGGQPYEVYSLKKSGLRLSEATNVSIQSFIVYQIALVGLGVIAILYNHFFHIFKEVGLLKQLILLGFTVNFLVIIGLFIISFTKKLKSAIVNIFINLLYKIKLIKDKEVVIIKWNKILDEFNEGAKILVSNKFDFIITIILNLLSLVSFYSIPLTLLYGLGDYVSINGIQVIVTTAYVMLMGAFVPTPGGTGGLEYGFIQFFSNFITGSKLSALMLLWRFITYYFGMIMGAITLNIKSEGD